MIEHHVQREILRLLGASERARFSDIRPPELENNAFQYHLKQLMAAKLIAKKSDGSYALTSKGTGEYITSHLTAGEYATQGHDIFLLVVRDSYRWLLATRQVQPQFGQTGFLHGEPTWDKPLLEAAKERLLTKSGLEADFSVRGSGYITITIDSSYSSFVHATLLYADGISGTFSPENSHNKLGWYTFEEMQSLQLIPSVRPLIEIIQDSVTSPFFDLHYDFPEF